MVDDRLQQVERADRVRHHRLVRPVPRLADVRLRAEVEDVRLVAAPASGRASGSRSRSCRSGRRRRRGSRRRRCADVVQRARGGRAHERDHVGAELDERVGQVRAHEAVGAGDEARAARVGVAEVAPQRVELVLRPDGGIVARHRCRVTFRPPERGSKRPRHGHLDRGRQRLGGGGRRDSLAEVRPRREDRRLLRRLRRLRRARARRERAARRRAAASSPARRPPARLGREVGVLGGRARRAARAARRGRDRRAARGRRRAHRQRRRRRRARPQLLPWLVPAAAAQVYAGVAASALAALDDYGTAALGFALGAVAGLVVIARVRRPRRRRVRLGPRGERRDRARRPARGCSSPGAASGGPAARSAAPARPRRGRGAAVRAPGAVPDRATGSRAGSAPGAPTTFSYAYLIAALLVAVTATSLALVSSVPLARGGLTPERDGAARRRGLVALAARSSRRRPACSRSPGEPVARACSARATAAAPAPSSAGSSSTSRRGWSPRSRSRSRSRCSSCAAGRAGCRCSRSRRSACRCRSSGRPRRSASPGSRRDGGHDRGGARRAARCARRARARLARRGRSPRRLRRPGARGASALAALLLGPVRRPPAGSLLYAVVLAPGAPRRSWRPGLAGYLGRRRARRYLRDGLASAAVVAPSSSTGTAARTRSRACARSAASRPGWSVIFVDNGSTDGSVEAVAREFPGVELIGNGANLGFAGRQQRRHPAGARARRRLGAGAEQRRRGRPGVPRAAARRGGAAPGRGGALPEDPVRRAARRDLVRRRELRPAAPATTGASAATASPTTGASTTVVETGRVCGAAMLVPRAVLEKVGVFDPELFAYSEDTDWSLRAREAGYRHYVVPASRVWHKVSAASGGESSPTALYYGIRNALVGRRAARAARRRSGPGGGGWSCSARTLVQALRSSRTAGGLAATCAGLARLPRGPSRRARHVGCAP